MKPLHQLPVTTEHTDENGYEIFKEVIWYNGEVCNSCFAMVRSIGPEIERQLNESKDHWRTLGDGPPISITINEWYERTDNGSQEHTTWDHNKRFGTCFCESCGTDCNGNHRNKSLAELKPLVGNIYTYIDEQTEYELDTETFAMEVCRLKKDPGMQGHETELMALAFSRALELDRGSMTPVIASA